MMATKIASTEEDIKIVKEKIVSTEELIKNKTALLEDIDRQIDEGGQKKKSPLQDKRKWLQLELQNLWDKENKLQDEKNKLQDEKNLLLQLQLMKHSSHGKLSS